MPEITTPEHVLAMTVIGFAILAVIMAVVLVWAVKYVINRSANSVQKEDFLLELKSLRADFAAELIKGITADKLKIAMLEQQQQVDSQLQIARQQIRHEVETIVSKLQSDVSVVRDTVNRIDGASKYYPQAQQATSAGSAHDIT